VHSVNYAQGVNYAQRNCEQALVFLAQNHRNSITRPAYLCCSLTGQFSTFQDALQAPEGAPASSGVVVEQGESCLYVKVNCRDRRGLLGDIILALKAMPLEV
jgi:hypothetical protein